MDPAPSDLLLLDGGMGQELLRHASADPTPLWSAQVMIDQPDLVSAVHRSYLAAGADVITLNSYSATRCRLAPFGLEHDYERLQTLAGELAVDARGDHEHVLIAGCLPPYRWTYRPELAPPYAELWPQYAETASLQAPYVDVILCETMGSIEEARSAVRGASEVGRPIWVSWSLLDGDTARLRSGEPLAAAIAAVDDFAAEVDAVLVNCSVPEAITAAMPALATGRRRFGAYANGFSHIVEEYHTGSVTTELGGRHDLGPDEYATIVDGWVGQGARIVGGCCEIGPDHIAELARRFGRRRRAAVS